MRSANLEKDVTAQLDGSSTDLDNGDVTANDGAPTVSNAVPTAEHHDIASTEEGALSSRSLELMYDIPTIPGGAQRARDEEDEPDHRERAPDEESDPDGVRCFHCGRTSPVDGEAWICAPIEDYGDEEFPFCGIECYDIEGIMAAERKSMHGHRISLATMTISCTRKLHI